MRKFIFRFPWIESMHWLHTFEKQKCVDLWFYRCKAMYTNAHVDTISFFRFLKTIIFGSNETKIQSKFTLRHCLSDCESDDSYWLLWRCKDNTDNWRKKKREENVQQLIVFKFQTLWHVCSLVYCSWRSPLYDMFACYTLHKHPLVLWIYERCCVTRGYAVPPSDPWSMNHWYMFAFFFLSNLHLPCAMYTAECTIHTHEVIGNM